MIKLYHVSFDLSEPLCKRFEPRIPQNTVYGENESVPRICFSDSVQGCIRAIAGYPKTENGVVDVIIWELMVDEEDEFLCDWKYLYENNIVPDAAVTHEYWYKKEVVLHGKKYRIGDIEYKLVYAIPLKYKSTIVDIISEYIDDISIFEGMNPCEIINEWVPDNLANDEKEIVEKMKELVRYYDKEDECSTHLVSKPDYDPVDMLTSYSKKIV